MWRTNIRITDAKTTKINRNLKQGIATITVTKRCCSCVMCIVQVSNIMWLHEPMTFVSPKQCRPNFTFVFFTMLKCVFSIAIPEVHLCWNRTGGPLKRNHTKVKLQKDALYKILKLYGWKCTKFHLDESEVDHWMQATSADYQCVLDCNCNNNNNNDNSNSNSNNNTLRRFSLRSSFVVSSASWRWLSGGHPPALPCETAL